MTPEDAVKRRPHFLDLTPEAKRVWVAWFDRWADATAASQGEQASAMAKLEAYAARLALLDHACRSWDGDDFGVGAVGPQSMRSGIALTEWFAQEAVRVYGTLREPHEERDRRSLVEWIAARGGRAAPRDLQRANRRRWPTSEDAEADLEALAAAGLGEWREGAKPQGGGAAPRWLQLHATAPDKSDRRAGPPPRSAAAAPDTRGGKRSPAPEFPEESERLSDLSGAVADGGGGGQGGPAGPSVGPGVGHDGPEGNGYPDGIDPFPEEGGTP